jgi:hypothetical protein
MTREEAKRQLDNGKQITHKLFLDVEFIGLSIIDGFRFIHDKNGYLLSEKDFWKYRDTTPFDDGWELFN